MAYEADHAVPLRESVYHTLRKSILTGELKPGERLREISLGKNLGTSRTPIREAIRKLEQDGLVQITPRSGARVAPISQADLKDVLEVRRTLDVLCADLASRRISAEGKRKLSEAMMHFEQAVKRGDRMEVAGADVDIHDIILEETGNRKLKELFTGLADQIYRYRFEYIKDESHDTEIAEEHRELVEAILAGDRERAMTAARVHIDNQEQGILYRLREKEN